ncbi:MAG: hypothetical protein WKG01_23070 [Kofleriaceae bacterium]
MQRTSDLSVIEARLLDLAHTTTVTITAPVLAYYAPCSIEDAGKVLDALAARDVLSLEVDDHGGISYELRGRQQLAAGPRPALPPPVAVVTRHEERRPSALLAAGLSLWIPGLGQLYTGRVMSAILWFFVVGAGYLLIIPGLILHVFCILGAASSARTTPRGLLHARA